MFISSLKLTTISVLIRTSTAPSDGALMEKPVYTNFTNGLGVFSTVSQSSVEMIPIGAVTLDSLAYGQLTRELGFLDHNGMRIDE